MYMYVYIYIYTYIHIHIYRYTNIHIYLRTGPISRDVVNLPSELRSRSGGVFTAEIARLVPPEKDPQLRFIHVRQLFRIQHTCFQLDAVNVDWWICINFRLVGGAHGPGQECAESGLHVEVSSAKAGASDHGKHSKIKDKCGNL